MTDIVERLHAHVASDHVRGCMGRQYSCTCGYDTETEKLLAEVADEIDQLTGSKAALQAEIERLRALSEKLWTEHLIEREVLKAEIERLKLSRANVKRAIEELLERYGQVAAKPVE